MKCINSGLIGLTALSLLSFTMLSCSSAAGGSSDDNSASSSSSGTVKSITIASTVTSASNSSPATITITVNPSAATKSLKFNTLSTGSVVLSSDTKSATFTPSWNYSYDTTEYIYVMDSYSGVKSNTLKFTVKANSSSTTQDITGISCSNGGNATIGVGNTIFIPVTFQPEGKSPNLSSISKYKYSEFCVITVTDIQKVNDQ